jgi:hypothetical protein
MGLELLEFGMGETNMAKNKVGDNAVVLLE